MHPQDKIENMVVANLIAQHTNIPGKPVNPPRVWIAHSLTRSIEVSQVI